MYNNNRTARKAFDEYSGIIPKVADLNLELAQLMDRKKKAYADYQQAKKDMKDFQSAKSNIDSFLRKEEKQNERKKNYDKSW